MEEVASVKLPSQLMKKELPIEDFVRRIEMLVKERETEASPTTIAGASSSSLNTWHQYEDSIVVREDTITDTQQQKVD